MTIEQAIAKLNGLMMEPSITDDECEALEIAIDVLKEKIAGDDGIVVMENVDCVTTNCTSECPRGGYQEDGKTVCEKYAEKSDRIMELHESAEVKG